MKFQFTICILVLLISSSIQAQQEATSYLLMVRAEKTAQAKEWLNAQGSIVRKVFSNPDIYEVGSLDKAALQVLPFVGMIEKNERVEMRSNCQTTEVTPNDPEFPAQWNMTRIGMPEAWQYTKGGLNALGDTLVAAVVDAGFDLNNADLKNNLWKNWGELRNNGIDDDGNGFIDDFNGWVPSQSSDVLPVASHGTGVAGIMAAEGDNQLNITGVNWKLKLMTIGLSSRTNITQADVLACYDYATQQRRIYNQSNGQRGAYVVVINSSFGITNGRPADYPIWCAVYDAMGQEGILNVAATANQYLNVDTRGDIPTGCASNFLISVTASNRSDLLLSDAAYGLTSIDLAAPGQDYQSLCVGGACPFGNTSGASPHVAGAVALLHAFPSPDFARQAKAQPAQMALLIKQALIDGVDFLPNFSTLMVSSGRLNVAGAFHALRDLLGVPFSEEFGEVYPNPCKTGEHLKVNIELPYPDAYVLEIVDMIGRNHFFGKVNADYIGPQTIDLGWTPQHSGCYFVRFRSGSVSLVRKIIVQ